MARTGEEQPLTAVAGNDSAASNTGSTPGPSGGIINPSSGEDVSSPSAAAAAAAAAAVASTARGAYGAVSGLVDKNSAANPLSGGNISLGDIYGEREGRGDRRGPPLLDADDEAAQMASAVIDAMETDSAKGVHNPLRYLATEELSAFNPYDHPHQATLPTLADEKERLRPPYPRDDSGAGGAFNLTFRGRSPKFTRFGVLLLITLLPFGAHFAKSCFSSLETYFLQDPKLHFNATKYGSVMSAISVPNLFMPFFGGMFLDARGHKNGIVLFLTIELIGHVMFTLAMGYDNFWLAFAGEALHGLGSGTVVVGMRSVVSKFFLENELTFALGVTVAGACVSKTLAKASVAPIAETSWGYMGALWYVGLWQVLSLLAGLIYVRVANSAHRRVGMQMDDAIEHKDLRPRSLVVALKRSTLSFWLVAILHTLFMLVYHLFSNYSGHFLFENYKVSPVLAGYISALMPLVVVLCAPIAGLILDRWGRQLFVLLVANAVTIFAYFLLIQERAGAVLCIVMLALCESFVPTILLSALPLTVHPSVYGAAFGVAEVLSAVASIVSTVFFGYSRDKTASYKQDLCSLLVLGFVCMGLTLFLTFWDARRGWSVLNRPGNVTGSEALRGR